VTVIRVFGPPGTGKTYMLNRIVFHMIGVEDNTRFFYEYNLELPHKSYTMSHIAYVSFMNSAVDELLGRLGVKRNYKSGPWGTLHGLALHLLIKDEVIPKEIVSNTFRGKAGLYWWRRKFTYEYGLPYDPEEEVKMLMGNQLFDGLSYAVNVYYPQVQDINRVLDKLYEVYENKELVRYAEEWLKFKEKNNIIDFDDILMYAYDYAPVLDAPVLVVDEFQDFGPLQYEIFKIFAQDKEWVIVAGDDDQVVSSYCGAEPRFLVELPGVGSDFDVVLKRSHRIPEVVHEASQSFIKKYVKYRYPKEFLPRAEGGTMWTVRLGYHYITRLVERFAQKNYSVLVLARTNALVRDLEKLLLTEGIEYYRYKSRVTQVWRDFINRIYDVIYRIKHKKKVKETELRFFFRFTKVPESKVNAIAKAFATGNVPLDMYKIFDKPLRILEFAKVAEYLGSQEKADLALRALHNLVVGKREKFPGKITIETIHASKGREADIVILLDTITPRIFSDMSSNRDNFEAEMRVWYVAMTRARHALITIPIDIPLVGPLLRKVGFNKIKTMEGA